MNARLANTNNGLNARKRRTNARWVNLATDGDVLACAGGRSVLLGQRTADEAARALVPEGELVIWATKTFITLSSLGEAKGSSGWRTIGDIHVAPAALLGPLLSPWQAVTAAEQVHDSLGTSFAYSPASTIHRLIKQNERTLGASEPEPELVPGWVDTAYASPAYAWSRPLNAQERAAGFIRAYDRNGSFLSAWSGLNLPMGQWIKGDETLLPSGPESELPPGYWLVAQGEYSKSIAARHGSPRGPFWVTTPMVQLIREMMAPGFGLRILSSFTTTEHRRALDRTAETLRKARETLLSEDSGNLQSRNIALGVIKEGYAGAVAWFEYGPQVPDPLARPSWRRSILDRHVANTWRSLAKVPGGAFMISDVDTAYFAVPHPQADPTGLNLGTGLGQWKPKGPAVHVEHFKFRGKA